METSNAGERTIHGQSVRGVDVDAETRCAHWHGPTDIIALRMKCCGDWFPCHDCHAAVADHPAAVWPIEERDSDTVLCGNCGAILTAEAYLSSDSTCPHCRTAFNPGCATHYHLYFEVEPATIPATIEVPR